MIAFSWHFLAWSLLSLCVALAAFVALFFACIRVGALFASNKGSSYYMQAISRKTKARSKRRFVRLANVINMRDIGGHYYTMDGMHYVKEGVVYRAAHLNAASADDVQFLRDELRLRRIIDLRSKNERKKAPNVEIDADAVDHWLPLYQHLTWKIYATLITTLVFRRTEASLTNLSVTLYKFFIDVGAKNIGNALKLIADVAADGDSAILFHCTFGKDRTGVLAAVLLLLLGVADADVCHDYALSNHVHDLAMANMARLRIAKFFNHKLGIRPLEFAPFVACEEHVMQSVIDHIREKFGSVEAFVVNECGVSPQVIAKLRKALIVEVQ